MSYQSYNSLGGWTVRDGEGYEYQDGVNVNPNTTAHRGWFLSFCFALSIWTAIGIGLLVATNLVLSVMTATVTTKEGLYLVVYHIDGIALAAFCLVIELELTETIRSIPIIQNWIFKGFIYIFSALFTLREYSVVSYRWNFIPAVVKFVCLNVIVTAIVYFCMVSVSLSVQ